MYMYTYVFEFKHYKRHRTFRESNAIDLSAPNICIINHVEIQIGFRLFKKLNSIWEFRVSNTKK